MMFTASATWLALVMALATAAPAFGYDYDGFGYYDSSETPTQPAPHTEFMLTFDDGPLPGATDRVLDALAGLRATDGKPVRAAFFLVGDDAGSFWPRRVYYAPYEPWTMGSIAKYPQLAQRIKQAGHVIGNHTVHHAWFYWPWLSNPAAIRSEILQWEAIAEPVLGRISQRLLRPPYLTHTGTLCDPLLGTGYQIVEGTVVGDVWPGVSKEQVWETAQGILEAWNKPYPCVLIFHDTRTVTYRHIGDIVRHLQQQGFRLVHFAANPSANPLGCANN